jgi:hypothetical protein
LVRILVANAKKRLVGSRLSASRQIVGLRLDVRYLPPQKERTGGKQAAGHRQENRQLQ